MNPPETVCDLSLLEHEPLCSHITMLRCSAGQRSSTKDSVARFVEAMQRPENGQAAAAAKKWASLLFRITDESSLQVTDGGKKLYEVFLEYQYRLFQGKQEKNFDKALQYEAHIHRGGFNEIRAVQRKGHNAHSQCATGGKGKGSKHRRKGENNQRTFRPAEPKKACQQVDIVIHHPDAGDHAIRSNSRRESQSTCSTIIQPGSSCDPPPAASLGPGVRRSTLPETVKPSKHSTSKKEKKRKARSQKPPIISPSDASEDGREPPKTSAVTAANAASHRPKRVASNSFPQPHDLPGVEDQLDKTNSAYKAEPKKQNGKGTITISQSRSPLPSDDFISHSRIKDGRGAVSPLTGRKANQPRASSVSTQPNRPSPSSRRLQKLRSVRDLQPRANKRLRRASMPAVNNERGEEPGSTRDGRVLLLEGPSIQELLTAPPLGRENVQSKKRTRLEFETTFVSSDENTSANSHEFLGPDVRPSRPLPKKVRDVRLVQATPGVRGGGPSLEHVDRLLRDSASNALAVLQGEVGPDMPDWIQDKEQENEFDAEYELFGGDQEEANDAQVNIINPTLPKPPVPATPRMWAESRQEVCESFEYFRCYHSGVYSKGDIVKGYLLGAYAASRDIFHRGGKLIISHGGGKSESILEARGGLRRYQTDQDQQASDKSVRALLKTFKDQRPIVLLADDRYALFPYDLTSAKYTYVVLGLYWISHAWAERQPARDGSGPIVRWKFAFQWCEGQGDPWWSPQQDMMVMPSHLPNSNSTSRMCPTKNSPNPANAGGDTSIQCENCREHSPFVYKQGWMCLNPRCNMFWNVNGQEPTELDFREEFLNPIPQKFDRLPNIIPAQVTGTPNGITTTYIFSKGWHCTNCGRLSCRYKWEHWECPNCNFKHIVPGRVRSPKEFWHQRPASGFLHSHIGKDSGIIACRLEPINLGPRKGFTNRLTFILPYGRGKIHLILGTPLSNGDADAIFQMYQQQASIGELKLRRYPLRNHRARGLLLTNYFSQNSGEPYQYVGGSEHTVPFSEAPECVRRALALIKERASLALRTDIPFNEILSAAYMERQKMSFHSDSEKGLGPTVASLSLGSAALMHFRPHVIAENPKSRCTYVLTLALRHGDVLIMDGDGVQKYYEHTVVPMNFRIAATARCIKAA